MNSLRFEWNKQKAQTNYRKHGVSFDEAATVFYDPLYLEDYDEAHSGQEDRFKVIGESEYASPPPELPKMKRTERE